MLNLNLTEPKIFLNICGYLNSEECLKVGLAHSNLYKQLQPLFISLQEHWNCQNKLNSLEKSYKELQNTFGALDYNDPDTQIRGDRSHQTYVQDHKEFTLALEIATFWKNYNEHQLTHHKSNSILIFDYQKIKDLASKDADIKKICSKYNAETVEAAIRFAAAAKTNKISMDNFKLLCSHANNLDEPSSNGNTALHWALKSGNENFACHLLAMKANCKIRNSQDETPLHFAAILNTDNLVGKLLAREANIFAKDKEGKTAFDWAFNKKKTACIQLLKANEALSKQVAAK